MMFYKWSYVKRVMAELWDPNDVTIGAGRNQLELVYSKICDDREVYEAFVDVLSVIGEDAWQKAAARWHDAVNRAVQRMEALDKHRKFYLTCQIEQVLQGRRTFLQ